MSGGTRSPGKRSRRGRATCPRPLQSQNYSPHRAGAAGRGAARSTPGAVVPGGPALRPALGRPGRRGTTSPMAPRAGGAPGGRVGRERAGAGGSGRRGGRAGGPAAGRAYRRVKGKGALVLVDPVAGLGHPDGRQHREQRLAQLRHDSGSLRHRPRRPTLTNQSPAWSGGLWPIPRRRGAPAARLRAGPAGNARMAGPIAAGLLPVRGAVPGFSANRAGRRRGPPRRLTAGGRGGTCRAGAAHPRRRPGGRGEGCWPRLRAGANGAVSPVAREI